MKLLVASKNQHKITEISSILGSVPDLEIVSLEGYNLPEIIEDKDTFLGNAAKKALETAKYLFQAKDLNFIVLADDSGLMVDALHGAPGVYSARYAGPGADSRRLCTKLLQELKDMPDAARTARFKTVLVMADAEKILYTAEGVCEGLIAPEMTGQNGFGYDPVFYYPPLKKTFAELLPAEKNQCSHRYRALQNLLIQLRPQ
jgi:XTP/dITP diphosphohydrolase